MIYSFSFKHFDLFKINFMILADTKEEAIEILRDKIRNGIKVSMMSESSIVLGSITLGANFTEYCDVKCMSDDPNDKLYKTDSSCKYSLTEEDEIPTKPGVPSKIKMSR